MLDYEENEQYNKIRRIYYDPYNCFLSLQLQR